MPSEKPHPERITVTVVVSGQPVTVHVNTQEKVEQIVRQALRESGNEGQPPGEWELRTVDGTLIDQNQRVADAGITNGTTLFLAPRAGVGG